ncbi:hypothetical protein AB0I72_12390 [Nocardiopsis sp. NPDC049922]|uniref:hypothetical protein n=1 Tax=Nocardiopsis sp. NPDC049922 TaxID=3155157 RepID=UPI0033D22109
MADTKEPVRKKGLHGWRAAAAVFGCGTVAAFGVFGAVIGIAGVFLDFTSAEEEPSADPQVPMVQQTIRPRESTGTGAIDLCGRTIPNVNEVQAIRNDSGDAYVDPGEGEIPRSVTDECQWRVTPSEKPSVTLVMDFSYESFVADENGEPAGYLADDDFEARVAEIDDLSIDVASSGDAGVTDESYYAHGIAENGTTVYAIVLRTGDTVYEMRFASTVGDASNEPLSPSVFEYERDWMLSYIEVRLGIVGPG